MQILNLYKSLSAWPFGKSIFSWFAAHKAPYFKTIKPYIEKLDVGVCTVAIKKRWSVQNHLQTVHAIAMCNMCEFSFGLMMEAGLASNLRWIPRGMTVKYLKKAETHLKAICEFPLITQLTPGDHIVPVSVVDTNNQVVMTAEITVYVSAKK